MQPPHASTTFVFRGEIHYAPALLTRSPRLRRLLLPLDVRPPRRASQLRTDAWRYTSEHLRTTSAALWFDGHESIALLYLSGAFFFVTRTVTRLLDR